MKTVCFIPIKLNSERVPGKNIKRFYDGTPLMLLIQQACLKTENIDEVYVYCSDDSIIPYVLPGVTYIKRPAFLDGRNIRANDFIREFIKTVDADIYVNAHATSPFTKPETIADLVDKVQSGEYDSALGVEELRTFMWMDGKPVNFDPGNIPRTQDLPLIYGETCVSYVFTKDCFLKTGKRVGRHPYMKVVDKIEALDIDYPEDFEIANAVYKEIIKKRRDNKQGDK